MGYKEFLTLFATVWHTPLRNLGRGDWGIIAPSSAKASSSQLTMNCQHCASHLHCPTPAAVHDYFGRSMSDQLGEALHRRNDPFPPIPLFLHDNPENNNKTSYFVHF